MIEIIVIIGAVAFALLALLVVGGVTTYDIRDIHARQLFNKHPFTRRYRSRPVVTVLLVADQEIESVRQCLENLMMSRYRRFEVVVIDTLTNSKLRRLTTTYSTHTRPVRLFKSIRSEQAAMSAAYRRYGHGDIIAVLHAADTFNPEAIGRAVWHFNIHKNTSTLYTHRVTNSAYSSVGLFQTYVESLMRLSDKLMSTFSHAHNHSSRTPFFYRKDTFLRRHTSDAVRSHLADDVISYHQPVSLSSQLLKQSLLAKTRQLQSAVHHTRYPKKNLLSWYLQRSLTLYIGTLLVSAPFLLGYFIYLALAPHQPLFLLLGMGLTSLFLLFGLWSDQQRPLSKKLLNSLLIPASFIPLLIFLFVQLGLYVTAIVLLLRAVLLKLLPNKKPRSAYGYD